MKVLKVIWQSIQFIIAMVVIGVLFYATVVMGAVHPWLLMMMP